MVWGNGGFNKYLCFEASGVFFARPGIRQILFSFFLLLYLSAVFVNSEGVQVFCCELLQFILMPHMTPKEQDEVLKWASQGKKPPFICSKIAASRRRRPVAPLDITNIRTFLRGKIHRRSAIETLGRKRSWSRANVLKANTVRKEKIKRSPTKYVKWDKVVKASRVPQSQ